MNAESLWKWSVRALLALLLILANALLVIMIVNSANVFSAVADLGGAAQSLRHNAGVIGAAAENIGKEVGSAADTLERAGEDVNLAADAISREVSRTSDTLERAGKDLERAADAYESLSNTFDEAFR